MTGRPFPIREDNDLQSVPWSALEAHAAQVETNHGKSLEELALRGGLTITEAIAVLEDRAIRSWERLPLNVARDKLRALVASETTVMRDAYRRVVEDCTKAQVMADDPFVKEALTNAIVVIRALAPHK